MDYPVLNKSPDVAQAVVPHMIDANGNAVPVASGTPYPAETFPKPRQVAAAAMTRPANVTAYSAGDAVSNNATAAILGVWNMHNRADVRGLVGDNSNTWSYATATVRAAHASNTMRVSFVVGWQEDFLAADYAVTASNDTGAGGGTAGVGYDSTTVLAGRHATGTNPSGSTATWNVFGGHTVQPLGFHYLQALEAGNGTGTQTWYGSNGGVLIQSGLMYSGRF